MTGSKLIELIERIVKQSASKGLEFATVKSVSPLSIRIDAMDSDISAAFLFLSDSLAEHQIEVEAINLEVEATTTNADSHTHDVLEMDVTESPITILTRLKVDDRVAVLPLAGGQKYFVVDKVVSAS